MTDSQTLLTELSKLHNKEIDLGLDRITRLLTALGVQPKTMQTSIHIAGTNGKGSVLATLKAIAEAAGKSVNMYSSPHLIRFHERIILKGKQIEEGALCALLQEVKQKNKTAPISFFEATTAAAFLAMSRNAADINLIETGLGGRLDATNLCTPSLCAITPISHDHEEYLGSDIRQIAREKAGIFKKNTPAIIAPQQKQVLEVLEEEAEKKQTPLFIANRHWQSRTENARLLFEDETTLLDLPLPNLQGAHQIENTGTAIALAQKLPLPQQAIEQGIQTTKWHGRLQKLTKGKLVELAQTPLWLDGGHNEAAGNALSQWIGNRKAILIIAMLKRKNASAFLRPFADKNITILAPTITLGEPNFTPNELTAMAKKHHINATPCKSLEEAIKKARGAPEIILCGSLYFIGKVLEAN